MFMSKKFSLRCLKAPPKFYICFLIVVFFICAFFNYKNILFKNHEISITITVKTTLKNHQTRASQIISTWFQLLPENIYFITDNFDPIFNQSVNGHLIPTSCGSEHSEGPLTCKMTQEMLLLIEKNSDWSCHFDDDNYVNVPVLIKMLKGFDHNLPHHLGRLSVKEPMVIKGKSFYFGHGGAGICLSRPALQAIKANIANNEIYTEGIAAIKGDDVILGYLLNNAGISFTEMANFFAQHDKFETMPLKAIKETPVFCFAETLKNFINLPYFFPPKSDPYKWQTLHCFLFPKQCNPNLERLKIKICQGENLNFGTYGSYVLPAYQ